MIIKQDLNFEDIYENNYIVMPINCYGKIHTEQQRLLCEHSPEFSKYWRDIVYRDKYGLNLMRSLIHLKDKKIIGIPVRHSWNHNLHKKTVNSNVIKLNNILNDNKINNIILINSFTKDGEFDYLINSIENIINKHIIIFIGKIKY